MKIRGINVQVDVEKELRNYDWDHATWTHNKLIACSPFRNDSTPSFFVRLKEEDGYEVGLWSDSAGIDGYKAGSFITLYAFLKGISTDEAEEELIAIYETGDVGYKDDLALRIPHLPLYTKKPFLSRSILETYDEDHHYLLDRGISEHIQKKASIRYNKERNAIAIPWFNASGELINIKYRRTDSKHFWYERNGHAIRDHIYNINAIYETRPKFAVLTESETDALSAMNAGLPAIALGGANFSDKKKDLLVKSPIEKIVIATDMDRIGRDIAETIADKISYYKDVYIASITGAKDLNELREPEKIRDCIKKSKKYKKTFHFFV